MAHLRILTEIAFILMTCPSLKITNYFLLNKNKEKKAKEST